MREYLGAYFLQMTSSIVVTPKRHFLARKHVVWAIKRENRSNGSTWAQDREKGQDRIAKRVIKAFYFTYLGRSPHWTDFHKQLHSSCRPRPNHACKTFELKFSGATILQGVEFPIFLLILAWALQQCNVNALPVIRYAYRWFSCALKSNSTYSICCGLVVDLLYNISTCCGFYTKL